MGVSIAKEQYFFASRYANKGNAREKENTYKINKTKQESKIKQRV